MLGTAVEAVDHELSVTLKILALQKQAHPAETETGEAGVHIGNSTLCCAWPQAASAAKPGRDC